MYFEIAVRLGLHPRTARNHLCRIYIKLNVHNRIQALNRASELGYFGDLHSEEAFPP